MLDYRSWLGLGDDEDDDPVKKALGVLGQGASTVGQAARDVGAGIGQAVSGAGSAASSYLPQPSATPAPEDYSFAPPDNPVAAGLAAAGRAGVEAYQETGAPLSPWSAPAMAPARAAYIAERALPEIGGEIGAAAGRAAAGPDAAPYFTVPESVPVVGGQDVGAEEVGRFIGSGVTDPLTYVGAAGAAAAGAPARRVAAELARGLPGVGEAELLGRGAVGAVRGLGSRVGSAFAGNAERVAAADARMAAEADPAYAATLIVPEGSPVRARRVRDAPPMDLSEAEAPGFVRAAEELSQGRYGPDSAEALDPAHPLEWHDQVVRINNRGQHDGDHPVSLPFYRNGAGDLLPLEPSEVGPMGSPVNSAYNAAVKAAGGRKGFVYGRWRDARGVRHEFDSPQEVVAMADLDGRLDEGAIDGWWSQANNPYPGLQQIPYVSTNRDKGGLKTYVPDLIVRHTDGSLEVIEIKSPEVIAKAEEYGMKAGEVSGKMGWDVVKKAAGIMAGLADQGVRYRLMLPHQVIETGRIPLGPNIAGQGNRSRRLDLLPGVDPRDAPKMRKKTITPAAGSPGVEIARIVDATSSLLMDEAERLKAAGVPDAERLRLLTRMSRDELLPTAELATSAPVPAAAVARGQPPAPTTPGRQEGLTRLLEAGGEAPLGSWVGHRGPLGIDDLDEIDPDSARILRDAEQDGGRLAGLAVHDRGDGAARLLYEIDGDPQAAIRASGRLALHHGADESARGIWYRDAKGAYPVGGLDLDLPGGDFEAIRAAIAEALPDATMVLPRYNSERVLEGLDLYGRAPDGTPIRDDALLGALLRAQRALEADGRAARLVPMQRAEMSRFAGEPGHARSPEAAVERAEQVLGRRPITVEQADADRAGKRAAAAAQRAADRGGAGRGPAAALGDAAQPAAAGAPEAAGGRLGGSAPLDDVDDLEDLLDEDDLLEASVALLGPYPRARGGAGRAPSIAGRGLATASRSLVGSMSGGYLGLGAPAETDEERRRNALIGAAAGLVGGPLASRAVARAGRAGAVGERAGGRAFSTLGALPDPDEIADLARRAAETPITRPRAEGEQVARNVARNVARQAERGVPPDVPTEAMPPPDAPPGWFDKYNAYRYSIGMFSNISTGLVQLLGGAVDASLGIPTEAIRTGIIKGRPELLPAMARESISAVPAMARAAGRTARGDIPEQILKGSEYRPPLSKQYEQRGEATKAAVAHAVEFPGRVMTQAPDALWNEGFYKAGLAQAAADEAAKEVGRTDPLGAIRRQNELIESPTPEVEARARQLAEDATYKGDLGLFASLLELPFKYPESLPGGKSGAAGFARGVGSHLLPVYRTIARIHERALEATPGVGMLPLNRMGMAAPERTRPLDQKLAQQAVGLGVATAVWSYAANGGIRGPGPTNPNQRQAMLDQGYVPNTFNVGGYWVPIAWLGMYGPLVQGIASVNDAMLYDEGGKQFDALSAEGKVDRIVNGIGRGFRDYPFADASKTIMQLGQDPSASFAGLLGETAAQLTPAPLRTYLGSQDTWARRPDRGDDVGVGQKALDTFKQRSGLGRQSLPIAQDILGRNVPNPRQGWAAVVPRVGADRADPVIQAYLNNEVNIGDPPKKLSLEGMKDPENAPALSSAEQRRWNEIRGELVVGSVQGMLDDGSLAGAAPEARARKLEQIRDHAAAAAHRRLRAEMGAEVQRRLDENRAKKAQRAS